MILDGTSFHTLCLLQAGSIRRSVSFQSVQHIQCSDHAGASLISASSTGGRLSVCFGICGPNLQETVFIWWLVSGVVSVLQPVEAGPSCC